MSRTDRPMVHPNTATAHGAAQQRIVEPNRFQQLANQANSSAPTCVNFT
jgi:hypothetical protein